MNELDIQLLGLNNKFARKKEILHEKLPYIQKFLLAFRKNYYIFNNNIKKYTLEQQLNILKQLSASKQKFIVLTEYKLKVVQTDKNRKVHYNEWIPGHLIRLIVKPKVYEKKKRRRKFPTAIINFSNLERNIPIREGNRSNILTFSFTNFNRDSYISSDYSYPFDFKINLHVKILYRIILSTLINIRPYNAWFIKINGQNLLKKLLHIKKKRLGIKYKKALYLTKRINILEKALHFTLKKYIKKKITFKHKKNIKNKKSKRVCVKFKRPYRIKRRVFFENIFIIKRRTRNLLRGTTRRRIIRSNRFLQKSNLNKEAMSRLNYFIKKFKIKKSRSLKNKRTPIFKKSLKKKFIQNKRTYTYNKNNWNYKPIHKKFKKNVHYRT